VNMRRDKVHAERVWNAAVAASGVPLSETVLIEVDISQCDKSQTLRNLLRYFEVLRQLGLGEEIEELWKVVLYRKTAVAQSTRFFVEFVFQVVSGLFATISMNSVITALAYVECGSVTRESVVSLIVSGDDALGRLKGSVLHDVAVLSQVYADDYNFEAKVFCPTVGYWCGRYLVNVDGYEFFVKDPERAYSMLARSQRTSYELEEAFVSFVDDTKEYAWEELVRGVASAVFVRHSRSVRPLGMARGVATVRLSKELFAARFSSRRFVEM